MDARQIMARSGLRPNRALGQNFLTDEERLSRIAEAALCGSLPVLEIGAGLGALTEALLSRGVRVVAVEKDAALAALLREALPAARVISADFLALDVVRVMAGEDFAAAGNLPYYATTPICEKLLCALPAQAVLMVQKEAAARFFAAPGDRVYGPLAVL
ncbi:MAG: rRNA adenine N-6-methyltransferase family protein, partial [Clostridia bacterium]|nr:rRNA adenine N-6-methyltransferase family protein [Clostridia bacterium]